MCATSTQVKLNLSRQTIQLSLKNYWIYSRKQLQEFKNDTAFLSSIMDTTFIELSKEKIKNKHEVLKTIHSNNMRNISYKITLDTFVLEDPVVHLYNNSAVVTFIVHTFRKKEQIPFESRTRFYDVWVKRNSEWKAVSWQASSIE